MSDLPIPPPEAPPDPFLCEDYVPGGDWCWHTRRCTCAELERLRGVVRDAGLEDEPPPARRAQILQHQWNNRLQVMQANIDLLEGRLRGEAAEKAAPSIARMRQALATAEHEIRTYLNLQRGLPPPDPPA